MFSMKDIQVQEESVKVKSIIQSYCNLREKKIRYKDINYDQFRQVLYSMSDFFKNDFNSDPYFFTITFPLIDSLEESWKKADQFIERFKVILSQNSLVLGGIISIEPHKNTSLKSKRGRNTKAGRPHFHMVLWFCHQFLNPSMEKVKFALIELGVNARIRRLNNQLDVMKAGLYTTKEKGNPSLETICQAYTRWPSSINIWNNHKDVQSLFQRLLNALPQKSCFISNEEFMRFPTARRHKSNTLMLTEIFYKVFQQMGLAVREDTVYRRIEGTRFSWEYWMPLKDWVADRFQLDLPPPYLEMLKDSIFWISQQGSSKKNSPRLELFPELVVKLFYIEFVDCVYEFSRGTTIPLDQVAPETSTVCYVDTPFHRCEPPFTLLGLLHTLIQTPKDRLSNREADNLGIINKYDTLFSKALYTFGGLYHPLLNRKQNPALFLSGEPSTFKTFLLFTLFKQLVGIEHIDLISRNNSRFNLGHLKKKDNNPYILILDDFRWDAYGMNKPDFLNLLDGNLVATEKKFEQAQSGAIKGSVAITSNQSLNTTHNNDEDSKAFKTRFEQVTFYPIQEDSQFDYNFFQQVEKEAIGFSILANSIFLSKNPAIKDDLQIPQSFFSDSEEDMKESQPLRYAGMCLMKKLLEEINIIEMG